MIKSIYFTATKHGYIMSPAAFLVTAVPVSVSAEYSALSGELTAAVKRVPLSIEETQKK